MKFNPNYASFLISDRDRAVRLKAIIRCFIEHKIEVRRSYGVKDSRRGAWIDVRVCMDGLLRIIL